MDNEKISISKLVPKDVTFLRMILEQHMRDVDTGEILYGIIDEIISCMCGKKDSKGRIREYLVARNCAKIPLGFIGFSEPKLSLVQLFNLNKNDCMEMLNFYVDKNYQRKGIGISLFDKVLVTTKSLNKKFIIWSSGPRFKESWGFYDKLTSKVAFIKGKYPGGDAKIWLKSINKG